MSTTTEPWSIETADVDENDRPILPKHAATTGRCPQCETPLVYAAYVLATNGFVEPAEDGTLLFECSVDYSHEAELHRHLFCGRCIAEYSTTGVRIDFG